MNLEQAQQIAESLKVELMPYCDRIEIGGSIRRRKDEVKDIELVCIPKFAEIGTGQATLLGGETTMVENLLFRHLVRHYHAMKIGEKYCQIATQEIMVDVFTATLETWGYIFMLRTGSADFSKFVVTELKKRGFTPKDGAVWSNKPYEGLIKIATPTEGDVFALMQMDYLVPMLRGKAEDANE